jgi:hypothetical protein
LLVVASVAVFVVALTVTPGGQLYREFASTDWNHFTDWVRGLL